MTNLCLIIVRLRLWAALPFGVAVLGAAADGAGDPSDQNAVIFVTRVRGAGGVVRCGLFDARGWLKKPTQSASSLIESGAAACIFRRVEPGTYAISAFHDANANSKLDTNFLGIPAEDYCASRDARGAFGPPSFDDAKFIYRGGTLRLEARMK